MPPAGRSSCIALDNPAMSLKFSGDSRSEAGTGHNIISRLLGIETSRLSGGASCCATHISTVVLEQVLRTLCLTTRRLMGPASTLAG